MKVAFVLISFLYVLSCNSQEIMIECRKSDVLIFQFKEDIAIKNNELIMFDNKINKEIYKKGNLVIGIQNWLGYGTGHFDKEYIFIMDKDTMNIECRCGQERNYYFKNVDFKIGRYKLNFENSTERILGSKINTPVDVQNILFEETYMSNKNPVFQDVYFKNIEFIEVDLSDTTDVKLIQIEL